MKLKPGDWVYAVRLQWGDVQPDMTIVGGGLKLERRFVKSVSDKYITISEYFTGGQYVRFEVSHLGRSFHATPEEAVEACVEAHEAGLLDAQRRLQSASDALDRAREFARRWRDGGER